MSHHQIQLGTCGWSYKDWSGVFYPEGLAAGDYLAYYAERYPIVEVDSTFYRSPAQKTVAAWRDKTPAGFGFSLKVPQSITHEHRLLDCEREVEEFLDAARLLGDKLRCCCLQFAYFNRQAFASLDKFLQRLDPFLSAWPKDVPLAVEIRNKNWLGQKLLDCLRGHQAVFVLADQAWMPAPLEFVRLHNVVTGPFAYFRFLGHREEVDALTETLNRIVIDRGSQVAADAEAMRLLSERVPVLAFVNNHFAGYAPETVRQVQAALTDSK